MRSDIYDLLKDNDKNKWFDSALDLSWSDGQLRSLIAFRLSRAKREENEIANFDVVIKQLFARPMTRAGGARRQRHVFEYILGHTLMRPRDIISYFRECARISIELERRKISSDNFSDGNRVYSDRLRQEFLDEIQGAIPQVEEVFHAISEIRKQVFCFDEFREKYDEAVSKGKIKTPLSLDQICEVLFHFSVVGNQPKQHSARIFKYIYPRARLNTKEKIALHKGLLQSFQIN